MKHLEHLWQPHHVGPDPSTIKVAHAAVMQRLGQETSRQGQFFVFVSTTSPSRKITPPNCNSLPLKNDGWKTILSFWGLVYFQGLKPVKLRECIPLK